MTVLFKSAFAVATILAAETTGGQQAFWQKALAILSVLIASETPLPPTSPKP